ncbi:MAG: NADH-quinone oxidoreductase subunit C [Chloroflexota bacterium]
MEPLEIAKRLQEKFSDEVKEVKEYGGQASVIMKKERVRDVVAYLKTEPELQMDLLRDLCGVDYFEKKTPRFEVVYHLYSVALRHLIRLRVEVPEDDSAIDSIVPLHIGADWHERECYDMFGISFNGHPDLRRILLPDDWEGHPLRKDYPLRGPSEEHEWLRFKHVVEKSKDCKQYEWQCPEDAS